MPKKVTNVENYKEEEAMREKWIKWALAESGTKTGSKILQKMIGEVSTTLGSTFLATMIVGVVQVVAGIIMVRARGKKIITNREEIFGSCLFGFFATVSTVLGFVVFYLGGEMGTNTFIITLAIVPGAFIDLIWFNHKLSARQWLGVAVATLAGYAVLGAPSLATLLSLPLWASLSFGTMLFAAINQGITQKIKGIDPFVKNFWGGATTFVLALLGLVIADHDILLGQLGAPNYKLISFSVLIGLIVVAMWNFNLYSYKSGASIAIKKLVMNGAYLISAMIFGILLFNESATFGKLLGVVFYLAGFALMDNGTWEFVKLKLKPKTTA